jgi:hypothetical protein
MHTSTEAIRKLELAQKEAREALVTIDNLLAAHDYQDVASLVTKAAIAMLESATLLMQSQDEAALNALERADDLLDNVYDIIDGELDEDDE